MHTIQHNATYTSQCTLHNTAYCTLNKILCCTQLASVHHITHVTLQTDLITESTIHTVNFLIFGPVLTVNYLIFGPTLTVHYLMFGPVLTCQLPGHSCVWDSLVLCFYLVCWTCGKEQKVTL